MCQEEEQDFHELGQTDELNITTLSIPKSLRKFENKKKTQNGDTSDKKLPMLKTGRVWSAELLS